MSPVHICSGGEHISLGKERSGTAAEVKLVPMHMTGDVTGHDRDVKRMLHTYASTVPDRKCSIRLIACFYTYGMLHELLF